MTLSLRPFRPADEDAVVDLWQRCRLTTAANNPKCDIERKLKVNPELFLVAAQGDRIVGTVMAGYEGHRGWINYLAVDPEARGRGIATKLMAEAEAKLRALGCPKVNLQVRGANRCVLEFYQKIGYEIEDRVSFGKRLANDPPYPVHS